MSKDSSQEVRLDDLIPSIMGSFLFFFIMVTIITIFSIYSPNVGSTHIDIRIDGNKNISTISNATVWTTFSKNNLVIFLPQSEDFGNDLSQNYIELRLRNVSVSGIGRINVSSDNIHLRTISTRSNCQTVSTDRNTILHSTVRTELIPPKGTSSCDAVLAYEIDYKFGNIEPRAKLTIDSSRLIQNLSIGTAYDPLHYQCTFACMELENPANLYKRSKVFRAYNGIVTSSTSKNSIQANLFMKRGDSRKISLEIYLLFFVVLFALAEKRFKAYLQTLHMFVLLQKNKLQAVVKKARDTGDKYLEQFKERLAYIDRKRWPKTPKTYLNKVKKKL